MVLFRQDALRFSDGTKLGLTPLIVKLCKDAPLQYGARRNGRGFL